MVVFGVITKNEAVIKPFFDEWFNKVVSNPLTKSLMVCSVKRLHIENDNILTILQIDFIVNFPFYWFGYAGFVSVFMLFGWSWLLIPTIFLSATRLLWSSVYYHHSIKKNLLKKGYKESVAFIQADNIIRKVLL